MLKINEIETGYGKKQVLFGLSAEVHDGEIVAFIGPNGAGKSTMLKTIFGLLPLWRGKIQFGDSSIEGAKPFQNVARGITLASQGGRVFHELTVMENLEIGGLHLDGKSIKERIENVLQFFPKLQDRMRQNAGSLSGGEQQMLAVARAIIPQPRLLMLDEPSLGLSPNAVSRLFEKILEVKTKTGMCALIVEQKVQEVLAISDRIYSIKLGKVAFEGLPNDLKNDSEKLKSLYLF